MSVCTTWARRLRVACGVVLCAVLAACALPKPAPQAAGDDAYTRVGRFALRVETTGGEQNAVQGGFAWRDDGRTQQLDLANPLGSTLARVDIDRDGAVLTRANGEQAWAANPDVLLAHTLGRPIPVASLRDWLRGHMNQAQALEVQRDGAGHPEHFVQDGWQVWLSRYDTQGPRLLRLRRQDAGQSIDVRLVVD